jgi:hypothetical protein
LRSGRLKKHGFGFFLGGTAMFDAPANGLALSRTDIDDAVPELGTKSSLPKQEELVFGFVEMPGKCTFHLRDLDFMSVERGKHFRGQ